MLEIRDITKSYEGKPFWKAFLFPSGKVRPSACWGIRQRQEHAPARHRGAGRGGKRDALVGRGGNQPCAGA